MKILFNPSCSKCQTALSFVKENEVPHTLVHYLETPLKKADILDLIIKLGKEAPSLVRVKETKYQELKFNLTDPDEVATYLEKFPELMERPILVQGDRAYIARTPEAIMRAAFNQ